MASTIEIELGAFLPTARASRQQKHLALAIAFVVVVIFIGLVPFAHIQLAMFSAFIPSNETALFFIDVITAVLLYQQFLHLRSLAVLSLASGYLFDALIIVPHLLTFPGVFSETGLLGAQEQTAAWLYVFWRGGFPLFVIAYAVLQRFEDRQTRRELPVYPAIAASVVTVSAFAAALVVLTTSGHDLLPVVIQSGSYTVAVSRGATTVILASTLLALALLWNREQSVIGLWLMLVMWIWLSDITLSGVIGAHRLDVGWYAGRILGLLAASFLLIALLVQLSQMYMDTVGIVAGVERKLAVLSRSFRSDLSARSTNARDAGMDSFIRTQNVERYRRLLLSNELDEEQCRSIERLLSEEEKQL